MPTEKTDMVRLRFFASLREALGVGDEQLELHGQRLIWNRNTQCLRRESPARERLLTVAKATFPEYP
jgi:molybdopterin converting factor small subunit